MSQQEDDLRALAKIMDFLRAVSILLVVIHLYWYCYEAVRLWGIDIGVVDRVLLNFDRTAGLFRSILYTKLFALVLLALSCLGTKGVKEEKITWRRIWAVLAAGLVLFFGFAYQPYGRRVQCGKREFHAGDPPHGKRVFSKSAHPLLL